MAKEYRFNTLVIHGGQSPEDWQSATLAPIYQTVRFNLRGYRFAVPNGPAQYSWRGPRVWVCVSARPMAMSV